MRTKLAFLVSLSVLTFGCTVEVKEESAAEKTTLKKSADSTVDTYKYKYVVNNCDTGEHVLSNKTEYCEALKNDALNNGCASEIRQQKHQEACTEVQSQ